MSPWQDAVKLAADYDNMKLTESKLIVYFGEEKYVAYVENSNMDVASAKSGILITKNALCPHYSLVAKANLINIHSGKSAIEAVDFDILSADAKAEVSDLFIGVGAELKLVGGSVSIFDLKLALGVDTGIGIKDDSIQVHALGTGFTIGRKVAISVAGSEFGIDFGRLFSW